MKRIHGTHVYTFLACPRAVALDLHGDPAWRRPATPGEELALARGRAHEEAIVTPLGWPAPEHAVGDFTTGAAATLALLRSGVPGVRQAVLLDGEHLGIPDLLRREPGSSALGDHHYVAGDVKSSAQMRGDQILQVAFYARLLGRLQQRVPEYGFLWLKDGREERFRIADYDEVLTDVLQRIEAIAAGGPRSEDQRPFATLACTSCRWSLHCHGEMQRDDDLGLVAGMTRGLRQLLEQAGVRTAQQLAELPLDRCARDTGVERRLLEQVRRAARARGQGCAAPLDLPHGEVRAGRMLHALVDAYAGQLLWIGALDPGQPAQECAELVPRNRDEALAGLLELAGGGASTVALWHWGGALPRWYDDTAHLVEGLPLLEARLVDLQTRLRASFVAPGPLFTLGDWVRAVLQREPHDPADEREAPLWLAAPDGEVRLRRKGRADLQDLVALLAAMRQHPPRVR